MELNPKRTGKGRIRITLCEGDIHRLTLLTEATDVSPDPLWRALLDLDDAVEEGTF